MAERRMFAKTIIDSDAFLDMPLSTQALYFHLSMRADDDGFVNNPKKVQRMIGASDDDLKVLLVKHFLIPFESGIVVIKHWRIHNYIRNDRYKETAYQEEKAQLEVKDNGAYTLPDTVGIPVGIPNGYQMETQSKDRIGKDRIESKTTRFVPPTYEEVAAYCKERKNGIDPGRFIDWYQARGWKNIKDWKACVRTWEKRDAPATGDNAMFKKAIERMQK